MKHDHEKNIREVSELITDSLIESLAPYREQDGPLWKALNVLAPEHTDHLDPALQRMVAKHKLDDALINAVKCSYAEAAYTVGIIAGLRMAERPDLVERFAKIYADDQPKYEVGQQYDEDGSLIRQ